MKRTRKHKRLFTQQGVAVIMVTVALVLLGTIIFEFSTNTTTDVMAATNARDDMRAHFLVRSGANLAQLIIRVQTDVIDAQRQNLNQLGGGLGDFQLADYAGFFMGAFGGSKEEVEALSELLGGFEGEKIAGLGVAAGTFDVEITSDDGKINVNCANGSSASKNALKTQLDALIFYEAYNRIFETEDGDGWRRDRQQQVSAIVDYIDRDQTRFDAPGTPEEYGYQELDDRYKAKQNYIDTVEEIKLIRGIDDRFWTLFGGQFTVYGDCRINVGAIRDPRLIATIIFLAAQNPQDPVLTDASGKKLFALAKKVAEASSFGSFDNLQAFRDFVKDPQGSLLGVLGALAGAADPASQDPATIVEGVELDMNKLNQIAVIGPRRTYRVEVSAELGRVSKRLTAVWDAGTQNQNARNPAYQRGTWVYWRED